MGVCKYCGTDAGFFKSKHQSCEDKFNEGCRNLTSLLMNAFRNYTDFYLVDNQIKNITSNHYISRLEEEKIYLNVFDRAINEYLNDGIISDIESKTVARFQQYTALPQQYLNANKSLEKVVQSGILQKILTGQLPATLPITINGSLPFLLQKDETILWVYRNVHYYEQKIRREYVGRTHGTSVRVAKGVYYRVGGFKGTPVETAYHAHIGTGIVGLTNKHVYFSCPQKSFKIPYKKLIHIHPFSDGLGLQKDGATAKPIFLKGMDSWFAYNAITNLASQ